MMTKAPCHSPIFVPAVPASVRRRPWYTRCSPGTMIGLLLLLVAICAAVVYVVRMEEAHEAAAMHRTS